MTIANANGNEGSGLDFTVMLDKDVVGGLTVTPHFSDVTADEGTDYTANTTAKAFTGTAGETWTFTVDTQTEDVVEDDETFTVGLNISGTSLNVTAPHTASGLIYDDDRAQVTVGDVSATEGASLTFTATLNNDVQGGLTVTPSFTNGTAESGDYTENTAALSFSGTKAETQTFAVATTEDNVVETDETFTVGLSVSNAPSRVTATDTGRGTIHDNETVPAVNLSLSPSSASESSAGTAVTVTAALSNPNVSFPEDRTVTVSVGGSGTAVSGTDYAAVSAFDITISAGQTSATGTFTLMPTDDAVVEGNETIGVAGSASGLTVNGTDVMLSDDDSAPGVNLSVSPSSVSEGTSGTTVTVTAAFSTSNTFATDQTVTVTVGGSGTAVSGTDYAAVSNFDITISAGQTSATGTFTLMPTSDTVVEGDQTRATSTFTDDTVVEGDETIGVAGSASGLMVNGTEVTLSDDDRAPAVNLSVSPSSVSEEASATTVTVTAALSNPNVSFPADQTVTVTVDGSGTATLGTDYAAVSAFDLTIATGQTSATGTFTLTPTSDTAVEGNETIGVAGSASGLTVNSTNVTLNDDDHAYMTIADASASEGNAISFTVTLDKAVPGGFTATPSYTNGTAASSDYTENTTALTFAGTAGETQRFKVSTTEDTDIESNETFTVSLSVSGTSYSVMTTATATGTISNDDAAVVTIADASAAEGDAISFTVTLDKAISGGFTVTPSYTNGTAASSDYTENTTVLTFAGTAGETQSFTVSTTEDTDIESNETFTVGLSVSGTSYSVAATDTATGTITNDDSPAVTIADASADEGKAIAFTVTLDKAVQGGLTVTPSFTDGTATQGTDYTANTTALEFVGTAGESVSFTVPTTQDGDEEEDETFTVGLSVSGTSHTVTATSTATGTIKNADETDEASAASNTITISSNKSSVSERDGATTVTLTFDHFGVSGNMSVSVGKSGDSATEGTDYKTVNDFTVRLTGSSTTKTFTLEPKQDTSAEGDETISVSGSGYRLTVNGTTIKLVDDEISLSSSVSSVNEADAARTVTVTAVGASKSGSARTVSVKVGKSGDSATEGTDYATVADFNITIAANASSGTGTFTLTPTDDKTPESEESISITGTSTNHNVLPTSIRLIDNDISLSVSPTSWGEQSASTSVRVTATAGANPQARTVRVSVGKGSDHVKEGINYANVPDFNITIAANATSGAADFTLTPYDDGSERFGEGISINGVATGADVSGTTFRLTDNDRDPDFTLSVNKSSVSEAGGAQVITVKVHDNRDNSYGWIDVDIGVGKSHDSATEGTDYATVNDFNIRGEANKRSATGTFTLTPTNDSAPEGTERIAIYSTDNSIYKYNPTFVNLTDDDGGTITLSTDKSSVSEDASSTKVTITATANKQQPAARTMNVYLGGTGSATYGTDYTVGPNGYSFTLMIGKNQTSGTAWFNLTPTNDTVVEGDETIGISANLTGFSITGTSVTLADDDMHSVTLSASESSVSEGASATTVTVTATAKKAVSTARDGVRWRWDRAATVPPEGTDYATVNNFDITIPAKQKTATGTFTLTPTDDTSVEGDETIGISGSGTAMNVTGTSMTLSDDDTYAVTLSASPTSVAEGRLGHDGDGDGHGHGGRHGADGYGGGGIEQRWCHRGHGLRDGRRLHHLDCGRRHEWHGHLHAEADAGHLGGGGRDDWDFGHWHADDGDRHEPDA